MAADTLRVGITCYPSVGGSGVLATSLGEDLAARGHDVHFIAYERPFRLPSDAPRLHFHPVAINEYELFRFPDYTLPLSVRMAEVSRDHRLDVLHVRPAARPRSSAASSDSATKWSWCARPTCAMASASTSCWRPPRACTRARPSNSSSSPARRSRRSPATYGAWA